MATAMSFDGQLQHGIGKLSPAERRVARFFQQNREQVLIASAAALAEQIGTSDATVVRTVKSLGYSGMEEMRQILAGELRQSLSPAGRMERTLNQVGDDLQAAFEMTLGIHQNSLENLRRDISPQQFRNAIESILAARRVFIFGIGPSSAMAEYFRIQLGRFGIGAQSLTDTGVLLADGIQQFKAGDLLMIFAYGRVYRELAVLLDQADRKGLGKILFTDTLGPDLRGRVNLILPVARGSADMLSMHTATLALIEALLVGVATERPHETIDSLEALNRMRSALAGKSMDLPSPSTGK